MNKHQIFGSLLAVGVGASCAATNPAYQEGPFSTDMAMSAPDLSGVSGGGGCTATATYSAIQTPAAMLVVLDKSSSMSQSNKWPAAGQAIVQAIDQDVFDTMSLGLYASPSGSVTGPSCILGFPVSCQNPTFAQVDLALAGTQKTSAASGVRHDIKSWLANNYPDSGLGDASPLYGAVQTSLGILQGFGTVSKRILLVVTDGTISCNQLSSPPRPGYPDANGCSRDWEDPNNIVALLAKANQDAAKPVESFIIGVPGADSYDPSAADAPPYHMRLALSAMAYAGSPSNVPANCTGKTFSKAGGDPAVSCHYDLTQNNFNAQALAAALAQVRGKVAGCTYDLPMPSGVTIDRNQVNVNLTTNGTSQSLTRRKDSTNPCTTGAGCWDYSLDGKVQLLGNACSAAQGASSIDLKITVGCTTILG